MEYKINEMAKLAGVSVRTLHHYDKIGLLKPKTVSDSGYRFYSEKEIEQLQQILFFKELEFSLSEIKEIMNSPDYDRKSVLKTHKKLLQEKRNRLNEVINTLKKTLDSMEGKNIMAKKEMFKGFDMTDIEKHKKEYSKEAKEKYGESDAYKESERKTSKYDKADWERVTSEGNEIFKSIAGNMDKDPDSEDVQELVAKWRNHISKNFYNCTPEIFRGLTLTYEYDERFKNNIDQFGEGLTSYLCKAMTIYCDRL